MNRLQIFIISILFTVILGLFSSASGKAVQPTQTTVPSVDWHGN